MNQPNTPASASLWGTPGPDPVDAAGAVETSEAEQTVRADLVLAGRHVSTAQFLAGLMAAAELDAVGRADRLPRDLFPDADPALVQEVWEKACAVAWRAAGQYFAARHDPAVLAAVQKEFEGAGFHAMAGTVGRSLTVLERAAQAHPADGQAEREH